MNLLSPRTLLQLSAETIRAPRDTFASLRELALDRGTLWQTLLLVVLLSVILAELANVYLRAMMQQTDEQPALMLSPMTFGALQLAVLAATVFLIDRVGRAFKGNGDLNGAILAVAWLQFIMVLLQFAQGIALLIAPPIAAFLMIAGMGVFFWLLTNFVAELHGFSSLGKVFGMVLFVLVGVALGLSFLLTLAGVTVTR